jgi:hypothetical protein
VGIDDAERKGKKEEGRKNELALRVIIDGRMDGPSVEKPTGEWKERSINKGHVATRNDSL